jgi:TonB family protein
VGRRLLLGVPVALAAVALLLLLGPSAEEVERKFTPYGARGPLRIMPEIAIEDGADPVARQAARQASPPPPAPEYQVEPDDPSEEAEEVVPEPSEEAAEVTDTGTSEQAPPEVVQSTESEGDAAVEMVLPRQNADSDFVIQRLVRPLYPAGASLADQRQPVVVVEAAFFLESDGSVAALMIQRNEGGPAFAAAAREAMEQWEFSPRLRDGEPPAPRWLVVTWRFRSPLRGGPSGS